MSEIGTVPTHEVTAVITDTTAELNVLGTEEIVTAATYFDVRSKIMARVLKVAGEIGSDVRLIVHDQTGHWRLVAQPDGQLREDELTASPDGAYEDDDEYDGYEDDEYESEAEPVDEDDLVADPLGDMVAIAEAEEDDEFATRAIPTGAAFPTRAAVPTPAAFPVPPAVAPSPAAAPAAFSDFASLVAPPPAGGTATRPSSAPQPGSRAAARISAAPPEPDWANDEPATRREARASFLTVERKEPPAAVGWRGLFVRATRLQIPPSAAELDRRRQAQSVSRHWPGPRKVAVVNGKGGVGKTVTNAMLAAVFARYGGAGVLAWDNNDTRGTLGWRTEKGPHDSTVQDLLPATASLLSPAAQISDLARFVHHQTTDKYDVLRSNPQLLAAKQRIDGGDFDVLHEVAAKYFRMVFFDSGNDESAPRWLRMIDYTDQLVLATTAQGEPAESGALLLEALEQRDEHSAALAQNAVVIVLQAERNGTLAEAQRIAEGFEGIARAAVVVPFDEALHGGALRYDSLKKKTQYAWLAAAAAIAEGL